MKLLLLLLQLNDDPDVAVVARLRRLTKTNNQLGGSLSMHGSRSNRYTRHARYRRFHYSIIIKRWHHILSVHFSDCLNFGHFAF